MSRPAQLHVTNLEAREVPAAGAFADIMPGIWGSYPRDFTTSGDVLYFAADNGHGEEVYRTDGTAAGTKLVKTLRPGRAGADPRNLTPAGNGVLYYTADDGAGRALYRTDGTAAGTVKLPDVPADVLSGWRPSAAAGGALYYTAHRDVNIVVRIDGSGSAGVWYTYDDITDMKAEGGRVRFQSGDSLVVTDGTGARMAVPERDRNNGFTSGSLNSQIELSPGRWLLHFNYAADGTDAPGYRSAYYVQDEGGEPQLLQSFGTRSVTDLNGDVKPAAITYGYGAAAGGVALFQTAEDVVWRTDGTPAGTAPVGPLVDGHPPHHIYGATFGSRFLASVRGPNGSAYGRTVLTDGTPAGTTILAAPDGDLVTGNYQGRLPAGPGYPDGVMVFLTMRDGVIRLYATDGKPGGARWVDAAGVPAAGWHALAAGVGEGPDWYDGAALNGTVYFAGPRVGDVRPEPWKWDIAPRPTTPPTVPPPAPVVPPKVASVVVNGGEVQRSMVTTAAVTFDRAVDLAANAVEVKNQATGQLVTVKVMTRLVGGKTVADIQFGGAGVVGGSLADGVYTLTVKAAKVTTAGSTTAMAADSTTTVHRLFGDLDGDRASDRASRYMVYQRLGTTRGQAGYLAAFDFDGNGVIDQADDVAIVRRWGRSV